MAYEMPAGLGAYGGGDGQAQQYGWNAYAYPQQGWPAADTQQWYGYAWPQQAYDPQQVWPQSWAWPQQSYGYAGYANYDCQNNGAAAAFAQKEEDDELPVLPPLIEREAQPAQSKANPMVAAKREKPRSRTMQILTDAVFWLVCVSLVAGSIAFALSNNPKKNYFGYRGYSVTTNSMAPRADGSTPGGLGAAGGFRQGDMVFVRMAPASGIKAGDIITFNPNSRDDTGTAYLTHRVVRVLNELGGEEGLWFVTKGDANPSEDPPISERMYIGKVVFHVPKVGVAVTAVRNNFPLALTMLICFFLCIFLLRWFFSKPDPEAYQESVMRKQERGKKAPAARPSAPLIPAS